MLTRTRPLRQLLATLGVLTLLVAPTGYVSVLAWRINQPGHRHEVERELGRQLGMAVALDQVRYPRPGVIEYRGLALRPDDAGRATDRTAGPPAEFARAGLVRLRSEGRRLMVQTDGLHLSGQGPRHAPAQLAQLLQRIGSATSWDQVSLLVPTCTLDLGPDVARFHLRDVAGTFRADGATSRLTASYRVVVAEGSAPRCELSLVRARSGEVLRTELALRTADGAPLPARVLDPFFHAGSWLGPQARITGELVLSQDGAGDWNAEFRGTLDEVDLTTLAERIAPEHRLVGTARLEIASARWADLPGRGPGWVEARGSVVATTSGLISTGLLQALRSELGFRVADRLDPNRSEQEFQALGLAFAFGPDGNIDVRGALGGEYSPDAVLVPGRSFAPLVFAPEGTATVPGLIRTLAHKDVGQANLMIPARFESLLIQRYLPGAGVDEHVRRAAGAN